ncbi:putative DNA helicase [Helianthus annuus]|nr:putative DNA helicase [Helianthus annuus]
MFSFTSMGGKVDHSVNKGKGPFVFRLGGQNCHYIGSLLPEDGSKPKFCQLYIYDTDNELSNRQAVLGDTNKASSSTTDQVDLQIIEYLKKMLDSENVLVKNYRMVRDSFKENPHLNLRLRLNGKREKDGRTYNLPTASEVAALIVGDIGHSIENRDIVVETKEGNLKHISELHPSYLALQYPLLFPYGEDCYRVDILHKGLIASTTNKRKTCSMREFFAYRIQDRVGVFSLIHNSRRLFQQFLVDAYTMIEAERLNYIRFQQKSLRSETYENLKKLRNRGNTDLSKTGKKCILPSSFTGGSRYMMQNYLDAMSICKWFGYPDIFITITCNPKWPEVKRFLKDKTINPEDRPDILCRLFKVKLDSLIKDLKDKSLLGKVSAVVYTVEFQKRGLPHAHICLFMDPAHKFPTVEHIDPLISAEIPDKNEDMELYTLVGDYMIHGPCGSHNINCPCMVNKRCSKKFPKQFRDHTSIDGSGFPIYRRRDNGAFVEKSGVKLDNRSVVPYNKTLLKKYQAHINVEWCNQVGSIKYLFKYINKGPDKVTVAFDDGNGEDDDDPPVDEIKKYYDCRYVSACEASWRIFRYDIHYRYPSVIRLPFHLPNQQNVVYGVDDYLENVLNNPSVASSMFLSWIECNKHNELARTLTYVEFPTEFVWKSSERCWQARQTAKSIGRIHSVCPALGEAYFLRILLNKVKGPTCFDDILTVNGRKFKTFREACYARGLLDDDKEYIEAIQEASITGLPNYIRSLFVIMLMSNTISRPEHVWQKTWQILAEGILYRQRQIIGVEDVHFDDEQIKNFTLCEIEKILNRNNSTLRNWSTMPYPDFDSADSLDNRLILEELDYDKNKQKKEFDSLFSSLTDEQRCVFNDIIKAVEEDKGGVFFVYGYGGTGKTFLWKTLSTSLRSKGKIVLNVASSGIASLLLTGGRTAHSRFLIPINLNEDSVCHIKPNSDESALLKKTSLIIWDEAPMVHRHGFEAFDKTLKDILSSDDSSNGQQPFGGKTIVFGGDFRQILPVIPSGSRQDIVNASLSSSYIWNSCKVLRLTKNMRLTVGGELHDVEQTKVFAQWLLDLGEGNIGGSNDGEAIIEIPDDLLIMDSNDPVSDLIDFVYPSIIQNFNVATFFQERAILAPTNEVVDEINDRLLSLIPGDGKEYLSSDSICESENLQKGFDQRLYSPDVLNGLKISGLPHHRLVLKVGVPIMLLRNIDQRNGLCNGTRLKVLMLGSRVIEAEVISGSNIGKRTFIPRIALTPSDKKIPFKFKRRQFPIVVCFAMTINKSQGQSLSKVGLFLRQPVFSHGQLYVALSRVKSRDGLKLVIVDKDGQLTNTTLNVVYKEVFRDL